ncbi:MAG: hypothetical protein IAI48_12985 [Candidatus Eremiobacteraeota bacterium]|nr:hypothetical protein [Candidatus Eremiobacteraeota bacterium]
MLALFVDAGLRIAGAIVLETLAFAVWNVGARSPIGVARDALSALRERRGIFAGIVALLVGIVFVAAATILLQPALPDREREALPVELATFLIALGLDQLIGRDLRALAGRGD